MKTVRIALSLMVLAILWCADAFAHGDGECQEGIGYRIAHFAPYTDSPPNDELHADPSGMVTRTEDYKMDTGILIMQI